jgi:hypothetical protein
VRIPELKAALVPKESRTGEMGGCASAQSILGHGLRPPPQQGQERWSRS